MAPLLGFLVRPNEPAAPYFLAVPLDVSEAPDDRLTILELRLGLAPPGELVEYFSLKNL